VVLVEYWVVGEGWRVKGHERRSGRVVVVSWERVVELIGEEPGGVAREVIHLVRLRSGRPSSGFWFGCLGGEGHDGALVISYGRGGSSLGGSWR